jgi:hypothetical protein
MSMAQVIEFYTLTRLTPAANRPADEERGRVIPFMSQRGVSDELVCATYQEIDSDVSR